MGFSSLKCRHAPVLIGLLGQLVLGVVVDGPLGSFADEPVSARVDFDRDVRPILMSRCVKCHGGAKPEAGLRLNDREAATELLDSGHRAVTPGQPEQSELLRRVTATDSDVRMPPMGERLTPAEIDALRRWIAAGAPWPAHWAYRPLQAMPVPDVAESAWSQSPIDRFILEKQNEHGLAPTCVSRSHRVTADAGRLRRVSL
jgi:hypothetical protein